MDNKQQIFARLANGGVPREAAISLANYIDGLHERIAAFEALAASHTALAELTKRVGKLEELVAASIRGPHVPKLERRG